MSTIISGKIEKGKIIPNKSLPKTMKNMEVRIYIFPKVNGKPINVSKTKGIYGDGLKFQKKIRQEWR